MLETRSKVRFREGRKHPAGMSSSFEKQPEAHTYSHRGRHTYSITERERNPCSREGRGAVAMLREASIRAVIATGKKCHGRKRLENWFASPTQNFHLPSFGFLCTPPAPGARRVNAVSLSWPTNSCWGCSQPWSLARLDWEAVVTAVKTVSVSRRPHALYVSVSPGMRAPLSLSTPRTGRLEASQ